MGQQIIFFDKNKLDIANANAVLTASEANAYVDYVRNRDNTSAWITTGSVDANLTNIVFDFGERRTITDIVLILHNLGAYTIQYWDGVSTYLDFSTPIAVTGNTAETTKHVFTEVETSKVKLIIQGTITANQDKFIHQFVATTRIGQLEGWPVIKNSKVNRNRTKTSALSGKTSVNENIGGFQCQLAVGFWKSVDDLVIVEILYNKNEGFLMWLCGGDESQFPFAPQGYRLEDLFLMKCVNEYSPDFVKGVYINGLDLTIQLEEAID